MPNRSSAFFRSYLFSFSVFTGASIALGAGCATMADPGGIIGSGGAVSSSGGAASSGGSGGGIATGGGTATGGGSGSGGAAPSTGGGGSGGTPGSGGDGSGGTSGSGGDGTGGTVSQLADPSPGCALGASTVTVSNGMVGYPEGYDGTTPVPVIFAFHAAGNPSTQLLDRFGDTVVGDKNLMIYLAATGNGWTMQDDKERFTTAIDQVLEGACVDQNRVYALGHSSGAQFIEQLLCDGETRFDAVMPIASSVYCSSWEPVPTLNFHGLTDTEREAFGLNDGNGAKDIVPYRTSNGCSETSAPSDLETLDCPGSVNPGCVEFEGCSEPLFWCNHNDPQYGTSNHGIPCFAPSAIDDFLSRL